MLQQWYLFLVLATAAATSEESREWRWEGKVAVVTGASSGIGAAIALSLADRGVVVVGLARRQDKIVELARKTNGTIYAMKCDLLKEEDILSTFRSIEQLLGGVDILINNAGAAGGSTLAGSKTEDLKMVLNLNVLAVTLTTREALKTMKTRGDNGYIININSLVGHQVPHFKDFSSGLYPASKFALTAISQTIANELSDAHSRIKVTNLSPGLVNTEIISNMREVFGEMNMLEPVDVADSVLYILSTRPNVQIAELTIQPIGSTLCGNLVQNEHKPPY